MSAPVDIVDTPEQAAALALPPLVVRRPLEAWLDEHGLGRGALTATRIGDGHSNATFLLERGGERSVLRRAPRPPLPPSAHDMLREARVLSALQGRARVPRVLAVCDDESVLGVPFYVMEELQRARRDRCTPGRPRQRRGAPRRGTRPGGRARRVARGGHRGRRADRLRASRRLSRASGAALLGALGAQRHARPSARRRARRPGWPTRCRTPAPPPSCTATTASETSCSSATGRACWPCSTGSSQRSATRWPTSATSSPPTPRRTRRRRCSTSRRSRAARASRAAPSSSTRYAEQSGRAVDALAWYEVLALWKAAVFCEGLYGRYLRGETTEPWTASLADGVPGLLNTAAEASRAFLSGQGRGLARTLRV